MRSVLIIDDDTAVAEALGTMLRLSDIQPLFADTPEAGLRVLAGQAVGVVIQDMNFSRDTTSGDEGVALFREIRSRHPDLPVILLTAWTHLETAVDLVKAGAADYLAKPWNDDKLLLTIETLLELAENTRALQRHRREARLRRSTLEARYDLCGFVFEASATERVVDLACQVARSPLPVLITGPNGAGKERIAQIVHANSSVRSGPMVVVNCGALPSELVEAELFGADAGAYTGAVRPREGRFEAADGGTLFLDEVGNLPLAGQVKLLRVLETGEFQRLGSSRTRKVQVRVISATNADLPAMIADGSFREDLYYRLNVVELRVPPLAERSDDILPLARQFLGGAAQLSEAACDALLAHAWPGNVRELRNAIERASLLCRDAVISAEDLNLPAAQGPVWRNLDEPDRAAIEAALRASSGAVTRAAQALGLSRQALYRRMQRFGLSADS